MIAPVFDMTYCTKSASGRATRGSTVRRLAAAEDRLDTRAELIAPSCSNAVARVGNRARSSSERADIATDGEVRRDRRVPQEMRGRKTRFQSLKRSSASSSSCVNESETDAVKVRCVGLHNEALAFYPHCSSRRRRREASRTCRNRSARVRRKRGGLQQTAARSEPSEADLQRARRQVREVDRHGYLHARAARTARGRRVGIPLSVRGAPIRSCRSRSGREGRLIRRRSARFSRV